MGWKDTRRMKMVYSRERNQETCSLSLKQMFVLHEKKNHINMPTEESLYKIARQQGGEKEIQRL